MRNRASCAVAAAVIAAGLGFVGFGAAGEAQAQYGPFPSWCPGDHWEQNGVSNWNWTTCQNNSAAVVVRVDDESVVQNCNEAYAEPTVWRVL